MSETASTANIAAALVEAMGHVDGAPKGSRNAQQGYDYTSTETMIAFCRGALRAAGLGIAPIGESVEHRADPVQMETRKGSAYVRDLWTFRFDWLLVHKSGETLPLSCVMPAESGPGRPLDKAKAGASSMALAYTLRDLLLIPRGEREVEVDARDDSGYMPGAPAVERQPSSPPASAADPFAAALTGNGLTREQWDAYAAANDSTPFDSIPAGERRTAAAWLNGEGSAIVSGWLSQHGGAS
jgi:hypothetical protein